MSEWREVFLEDVADELTVGYVGPMASEYVPSGIPFLRSQNVEPLRVNQEDIKFITPEFHERIRKSALTPGDVVIVRTGKPGACTVMPDWLPVSNCSDLVIVRCGKNLDARFLAYYVNTVASHHVSAHLVGAVQQHFNVGSARKLKMRLPEIREQRAIAAVLGALDDKIELNRRMNETLEAMARALFQSWFVNFDSVRASGGQFQDSAIGRIPKGWKVERFDKHITADRGLSYKGEGLRDDGTGLPMHNLNSVYEGGGYKHEGIKYYAGEYREKHLLNPGDMIVTNTEQGFDHLLIGHAAIVPKRYGPQGLFSHHIYRVRHKPSSPFSSHYLVELFNNPRWHYWISGFSNGTTINMLPKDALEMPLLVVPPDELVEKYTALAVAVHSQIEANLEESRTLAALRDALLPKLLSGELRLPVANFTRPIPDQQKAPHEN